MKNEEKYQKLLFLSELKDSDLNAYHKEYQDKTTEKEILPEVETGESHEKPEVKPKKWKKPTIVAGILLCILAAGIVNGNLLKTAAPETNNTTAKTSTTMTENSTSSQTVENTAKANRKYLSEATEWEFFSYFVDKDYDKDGKVDKVYQENNAVWIEFGNGTDLKIDNEGFDTDMLGGSTIIVEDANLTDSKKNEIIVLSGLWPTSTGYRCYGELEVYGWNGSEYVEMQLPFENGNVKVEYQRVGDSTIGGTVQGTDYTFEIDVNDHRHSPEDYLEWYANRVEEHEIWNAYLRKSGNQEQLVCRVNLLTHQDVDGLEIALKYENGQFKVEEIKYFNQDMNEELWESFTPDYFGMIKRVI